MKEEKDFEIYQGRRYMGIEPAFSKTHAVRLFKAHHPGMQTGKLTAKLKRAGRNSAQKRRISAALKKFLHAQNPKARYVGAGIRKNPGGNITIIPIKARRAAR